MHATTPVAATAPTINANERMIERLPKRLSDLVFMLLSLADL
jgi:hypothetical protein